MARVLLTRRANPKASARLTSGDRYEISVNTIWAEYLSICYQACKDEGLTHSTLKEKAIFETAKAFICHGADTEAKLFIRHKATGEDISEDNIFTDMSKDSGQEING
jgi:hypothetical protein